MKTSTEKDAITEITTDTRSGIAIAADAGIHDAPTIITWTQIFKLIDAARKYERGLKSKSSL